MSAPFNFGGFSAPVTSAVKTEASTTSTGFALGSGVGQTQPVQGFGAVQSQTSAGSAFSFASAPGATTTSSGFSLGFGATAPNQPSTFAAPQTQAGSTLGGASGLSLALGAAALQTKPAGGLSFGAAAAAPQTQSAGGLSFGVGAAAPQTQSAGGLSFGVGTSVPQTKPTGGLSFGAGAATPQTKPAGGLSFGVGTAAPQTQAAGGTVGFSFGMGGAVPQSQPGVTRTNSSIAAPQAQTSGLNFGLQSSTPASQLPASGLSLGFSTQPQAGASKFALPGTMPHKPTLGNQVQATTPAQMVPGTTATATASILGSLIGAKTTAAPTTATAAPTFSLPMGTATTGAVIGVPATAAPISVPAIAAPIGVPTAAAAAVAPTTTGMSYHQLEELINKWTLELDDQERTFLVEANKLNSWDRSLVENGDQIVSLHEKVEGCRTEQTRLEQELDFIEAQQRELEQMLTPLERAAEDLPPGHQHADREREAILQLAQTTELELARMLGDLKETASRVGEQGTSKGEEGAAMTQITRIMNAHMHSLNWIHHQTQELTEKVKVMEEMI